MSRFLAAFRDVDAKVRFSGSAVANKSKKAKTPDAATAPGANEGFSPFSPLSEPYTGKNALSEDGMDAALPTLAEVAAAVLAAPGQSVTDEALAAGYAEAEARRRIAHALADPGTRGLLIRFVWHRSTLVVHSKPSR